MTTLVITDIPRISALFEQIAAQQGDLTVVGGLHRGIAALEQRQPDLIIIQNHLSGLSADILRNHVQSRLDRRTARFALISDPGRLETAVSDRFEAILDPALSDEQFALAVARLLSQPGEQVHPATAQGLSTLDLPTRSQLTPQSGTLTDNVQLSQTPVAPPAPLDPAAGETVPTTYDRPRRPNRSIISAFSQHLDNTADELQPQPAALAEQAGIAATPAVSHAPRPPADEPQSSATPLMQRTGFWLVIGTLVLVVIITLVQQWPRQPQPVNLPQPSAPLAPPDSNSAPLPSAVDEQSQLPPSTGPLGTLPSFIPVADADAAYASDNPGWERYLGQANEFRIFREQNGPIKALQVIDRSGGRHPGGVLRQHAYGAGWNCHHAHHLVGGQRGL